MLILDSTTLLLAKAMLGMATEAMVMALPKTPAMMALVLDLAVLTLVMINLVLTLTKKTMAQTARPLIITDQVARIPVFLGSKIRATLDLN